jgi:hypothetical protein
MRDEKTGPVDHGGALADGLTNAEKLVAISTYVKVLKSMEGPLRDAALDDLLSVKSERVGAYLPGGEKIGTVGVVSGSKKAVVTDEAKALRWVLSTYPGAVIQSISPSFLKSLLDHAAKSGMPGEPGVDPETGELLDFIEVRQGDPHVSVSTTKEGVARMTQLAHGFAGMLEAGQ